MSSPDARRRIDPGPERAEVAIEASPTDGYEDALAWLYAQRRSAPRDPSRARELLAHLGIGSTVPSVHVVGTTGKGTVAAMVERGLRAGGASTGSFTSPHVEDFRERIEVDGRPLDTASVVAFVARVRDAALPRPPAFFEIAYAMALDAFERAGVEVAVVEAGVGARADATQTLERVLATVVTNVSLDHAATLGGTIAAIAHDKAASVRAGTPVITGATGVARAVIAAHAGRLASPLHADPPGGPLFEVPDRLRAWDDPARARNQRLAAATLRVLGQGPEAVAAGVDAPALPARRERFRVRGRTVILDGAHNPAGADALAASLPAGYVLVFGALGRKDGARTLHRLAVRAAHVVVTEASPGEGTALAGDVHEPIADPVEALARALAASPAGGTVVVAGSLYLAGRLRGHLRRAHEPSGGTEA